MFSMLEAGKQAPDFTLRAVGGPANSLREHLSDGPTVLAFFKISCPVCQLALPYIEKMAHSGAARFLGISQDGDSNTKRFLASYGVRFTTLIDEGEKGYPVSNAYGITHVPSIFVVEKDGSISHAWVGFSKKDMEQLGARVRVAPFEPGDKVPVFTPG
jgi:peroxiredoxin